MQLIEGTIFQFSEVVGYLEKQEKTGKPNLKNIKDPGGQGIAGKWEELGE